MAYAQTDRNNHLILVKIPEDFFLSFLEIYATIKDGHEVPLRTSKLDVNQETLSPTFKDLFDADRDRTD